MARLSTAVVALALLPLGGCAGNEPARADPLVVISGPKAFQSFALHDGEDRLIWRVVADPPAAVEALFFGAVPAGFRQETPANGDRPRPLVIGEPIRLESITPRRVFRHQGWVDGGRRFSIESWRMILRDPPAPSAVDAPPAAS